jgi:hypothetical protein
MQTSSVATIYFCVLIMLANAVNKYTSAAASILDTRLIDFGEEMLMVAYDSVAYGSLLRIVAYDVPMFRVLNIRKHEKLQRRFRRSYYEK